MGDVIMNVITTFYFQTSDRKNALIFNELVTKKNSKVLKGA